MSKFLKQKFSSYNEFESQLNNYHDKTFQVLVKRFSNKMKSWDPACATFVNENIAFECKHFIQYKLNQVDQSRPNQQSYFTNCPFKLYLMFNRAKNIELVLGITVYIYISPSCRLYLY